ncbi:hypothetical protein Q7689_17550 [Nocardiopsis tropica]|nr:hypothetical protein [Nocardiopsis tropica]
MGTARPRRRRLPRPARRPPARRAPPTGGRAAGTALLGLGPAPHGTDWSTGAEGLADAGLTAVTVEGELAVDPAVRFSLLPEHSPSAQEETEEEY